MLAISWSTLRSRAMRTAISRSRAVEASRPANHPTNRPTASPARKAVNPQSLAGGEAAQGRNCRRIRRIAPEATGSGMFGGDIRTGARPFGAIAEYPAVSGGRRRKAREGASVGACFLLGRRRPPEARRVLPPLERDRGCARLRSGGRGPTLPRIRGDRETGSGYFEGSGARARPAPPTRAATA